MIHLLLAASLAGPSVPPLEVPGDLQAVGLVVSANPLRSVAVLRSGGRSRLVAMGDTAFGGKVALIGREAVVLDFGGRPVELRLTTAVDRPGDAPVLPAPAAAAAARPPAPGAREMARAEVERRLAVEVPRILSETTAVPVMDEGRVAGLALTRVPDSSLLTDAGLQAGDVLTEVNGTVIDSLASLMALYPKLQGASELSALILRNGQPLRITVTLR